MIRTTKPIDFRSFLSCYLSKFDEEHVSISTRVFVSFLYEKGTVILSPIVCGSLCKHPALVQPWCCPGTLDTGLALLTAIMMVMVLVFFLLLCSSTLTKAT